MLQLLLLLLLRLQLLLLQILLMQQLLEFFQLLLVLAQALYIGQPYLFLSLLFIFTLADHATRRMDHELHVTKTKVDKQWVHPKASQAGKP